MPGSGARHAEGMGVTLARTPDIRSVGTQVVRLDRLPAFSERERTDGPGRSYPGHVNFAAMSPLAWVYELLDLALFVAATWAFADCVRRRPDAFPAVGRRSKGLWLALTGLSALYGMGAVLSSAAPMGIIAIAAVVITAVYLLDIRPKIIEITSGR